MGLKIPASTAALPDYDTAHNTDRGADVLRDAGQRLAQDLDEQLHQYHFCHNRERHARAPEASTIEYVVGSAPA